MLTRRVLAIYTAFLLLVGLVIVPQAPLLVCRMAGTPMSPVPAATSGAAANGSCCDVALIINPDGTERLTLTSPGCCELRPGAARTIVPLVAPPAPVFPVAILAAAPLPAPPLCQAADDALPVVAAASAPRAPPIRTASPRAPPMFS